MNEQRLVLGKLQDLVASNAEVVRALAASHLIRLPIGYGRQFVFLPEARFYAFSSTRWVAYSEHLRSVMENPNA